MEELKIVFFSNFINHHQVLVSDELSRLTGGKYYFVELQPMCEWLKEGGYADFSSKSYVISLWKDEQSKILAERICEEADIAIFAGNESLKYQIIRAKKGKICFEVSERWLKKGLCNLFSPRLIRNMWYYHTLFRSKPVYKLCASAFGAQDQYFLHSYENRCYKWGYFTKVNTLDIESSKYAESRVSTIKFMWCARFLNWKHPELPVKLAARLKQKKYEFLIDMYGTGKELEITKNLAKKLGVEDVVNFCGNRPNDEILKEMRKHDIFLFTSDRNEGWGAVLNEAMSNGCAVVGSDEIGSVPFLIEDGVNGLIFKSRDLDSLEKKVVYLIEHPNERARMVKNAYRTMREVWSPENAAKQLLNLIKAIQSGDESLIPKSGPCSKAL